MLSPDLPENVLGVKFMKAIHYVKIVRIRSFSGPYFPAFGLNIQSEYGKIRTRKTPNMDTFQEVTELNTKFVVSLALESTSYKKKQKKNTNLS